MSTTVSGKAAAVRIATGSYMGDGTLSQAITGIGFAPKFVKIWAWWGWEDSRINEAIDLMMPNSAFHHENAGMHAGGTPNCIISFDADGFTVDDNGADNDPNKADRPYMFMCLG